MPPSVTIIVATYNRPRPLRAAVESAVRQTLAEWRMIVVGDHCADETARVLNSFRDERILYLNLPRRFGEQSGPNSVGLALSETTFTAFLNHDDIWLQDHLEKAIAALDETATDFFVARSAKARRLGRDDEARLIPLFTRADSVRRRPADAFWADWMEFEPVSGWCVRTDVVRRSGPWRPAGSIHRTPAQEWLLRAWRSGASFCFGDQITLLNVLTDEPRDGMAGYELPADEYDTLIDWLDRWSAEEIRDHVSAGIGTAETRGKIPGLKGRPLAKLGYLVLFNPVTAALYRTSGFDAKSFVFSVLRKRRGAEMNRYARERTGSGLPEPPVLEQMVSWARNAASLSEPLHAGVKIDSR